MAARLASLGLDLWTFLQIVLFWLLALLVLWPLRQVDRAVGTGLFPPLERLVRRLAA